MVAAKLSWRIWFKQLIWLPLALALEIAGMSSAIKIAIMAITTNISTNVNPLKVLPRDPVKGCQFINPQIQKPKNDPNDTLYLTDTGRDRFV